MLKIKKELKISNLFLWGSIGLEGKMNDERMISQTPTVHKLDEVSSWCLVDCSKYVRESQWRRVNVVSHVGWSFLLLGNEERECALCHIGWLVGKREEEERTGLSCLKGLHGRGWKNVTSPFYSCPRKWPGQNGMKYSRWSKIWVWDKTVKIFRRQTIIWNSFCYKLKQKLLKCKLTIQIVTFNVRTLNK